MAESMIIAPVVEKSVDFVFRHTYQELQYLWKLNSNIQRLSTSMTRLEETFGEISSRIEAAKDNVEDIKSEVKQWVDDVLAIKEEVDEIIKGKGQAQMGCFFNCKCPNPKVRYIMSKKAAAKTIEITDLLKVKGEFPEVGYPAPIKQRPFTSPLDVFGFQSRLQVEERVMKALLDEKIHVIAVCGMGGVGKTTMVKKVADEVKKENHFDEVVMAVVSQNQDLINVQQQLAEKLNVDVKETTLAARADRLHTRLMDQRKRILLIIDDLWEDIDLGAIGIPRKVECKGLKVLLTSRYSRVCSQMDVKRIIEVGVLTEEESWSLFKKHADISDDDSVVWDGYPKKVANKCQGLPLAIEVIGRTLKNRKQLSEWRDALQQLESAQGSDISEDKYAKVYSSLEWSVNYLGSQCRSLLLLCSLFPEDHEIEVEDLVRYAKGLQLFKDIEKMAQFRDRMETFCNELKDCYLLIACDDRRVKLHDVVRDTCLRIASKGENVYMVSHSELKDWPDKDILESYTAISLTFDELKELPYELKCSMLQLLRLTLSGKKSGTILTSFLQASDKLRVVDIYDSNPWSYGFELPPQSPQTSVSLRTLNLHHCSLDGDLSPLLGCVVNVEVLSFYNSSYEGKWPKEIGRLSNLKSLDLRLCSCPNESLPTGILIQLKKLEEIYFGRVLDMQLPESYETIREIGSLPNLNTIEILECDSHGLAVLVENLDVEKLLRFYISAYSDMSPYHFCRTMEVCRTSTGILSKPKMKTWLSKVDGSLTFYNVTGCKNDLFKDFDGGSVFFQLRSLKLKSCKMKYILDTINSHTRAEIFVQLKRLCIEQAEQLEELCHGNIPPGSFVRLETVILYTVPHLSSLWGLIKPPCLGNLTTLKITDAEMLTSLFLRSSVKCFARLRYIEIVSCPKLETLVACDGQIEKDTVEDVAEFPELEELRLIGVCKLKTLCSEPEAPMVRLCSSNSNISLFPKLRVLEVSGPCHPHVVDFINNGQNISSLEMSGCLLEVCFDFEEWHKEMTGQVPESLFHNLDSLSLRSLPNLRHLWRTLPEWIVAFQHLTTLYVSSCGSLEHLFTPHMAKMLVNLKRLDVLHCEKLQAIVGTEGMEHSEEFSASNCPIFPVGIVALQNLRTLSISNCGSLKHLIGPHMGKMFLNLETLDIRSCKKLEAIVGPEEMEPLEEISASDCLVLQEGTIVLQNLTTLTISECGHLKHLLPQSMAKMLASLKSLEISECDEFEATFGLHEISPSKKVSANKVEKIFEQLELLRLQNLPQLRNFRRMIPEGTVAFQKLLTLTISRCGGFRYLLTPPVVKMFASLKELELSFCGQMESIIGTGEVDEPVNEVVHPEDEILLPELCKLRLICLPEFRMLCSQSTDLSLPLWNNLSIDSCPRMFKFCAGNLISPELKQVLFFSYNSEIDDSFELDFKTMKKWLKDCESGKRCIDCAASRKGETCDHLSQGSSMNKNNEDDETDSSEDSAAEVTNKNKKVSVKINVL